MPGDVVNDKSVRSGRGEDEGVSAAASKARNRATASAATTRTFSLCPELGKARTTVEKLLSVGRACSPPTIWRMHRSRNMIV